MLNGLLSKIMVVNKTDTRVKLWARMYWGSDELLDKPNVLMGLRTIAKRIYTKIHILGMCVHLC